MCAPAHVCTCVCARVHTLTHRVPRSQWKVLTYTPEPQHSRPFPPHPQGSYLKGDTLTSGAGQTGSEAGKGSSFGVPLARESKKPETPKESHKVRTSYSCLFRSGPLLSEPEGQELTFPHAMVEHNASQGDRTQQMKTGGPQS